LSDGPDRGSPVRPAVVGIGVVGVDGLVPQLSESIGRLGRERGDVLNRLYRPFPYPIGWFLNERSFI